MAITPSQVASTLALELDGQAAGLLHSLQPPAYRIARTAAMGPAARTLVTGTAVSLGEMTAEFNPLEPGPLITWMGRLLAGEPALASGVVQVLDRNRIERRRLVFGDGVLTAVRLPTLSATAAKQPFTVGLSWQPASLDDQPGSGKPAKGVISKRKPLLTANFRVAGLPFDATFVAEVALPTVSVTLAPDDGRSRKPRYAHFDGGELGLGLRGRSATEALAWVRKLISDGRLDPADDLDLVVELLDATLKKVMASIQLKACSLLSCEESPLGGPADSVAGVSLCFAVDSTQLVMTA
jgi:hypothetical protein